MRLFLLISAFLATSGLCFAEPQQLYVQSVKAKLMAEPSFNATVVTELTKGASVNVLRSDKRWLNVQVGEQSGWISSFLLSKQPPIDKVTVLDDPKKQNLEPSARRRASAVTTAGAARGLSADDRKRAHGGEKSDYFALEQVEDYSVSEQEVGQFIDEGMGQ